MIQKDKKSKFKPERLRLTLIFIPFLIMIILFKYVPIGGWILSVYRYKVGIPLFQNEFVGLANFAQMFRQWDKMWDVLKNTFALSGLGILFSPVPVIFAIMLSEIKSMRFKKVVQTVTTIPHFVSMVIIYSLAYALFSTEGVVNTVLIGLGIMERPSNLLVNNDAVWLFHPLIGLWKNFGWNAILYFAAISGIDTELYDAASVDGANRFQKIIHITVPGITNTYFTLLLLSISNFLSNGVDQYLSFYNSSVADKIMVLDLYTYRLGLISGDYSFSSAVSILKTIVSLTLLFSANYASKKIRGYSIV